MAIAFEDHDEYDDIVKDLANMVYEAMGNEDFNNGVPLAKLLKKLLEGEIVEA